jgi:hypothetical protein
MPAKHTHYNHHEQDCLASSLFLVLAGHFHPRAVNLPNI